MVMGLISNAKGIAVGVGLLALVGSGLYVRSVFNDREQLRQEVAELEVELDEMVAIANDNAEALREAEARHASQLSRIQRQHQEELERAETLSRVRVETRNVAPENDAPIAPVVDDVLDLLFPERGAATGSP